MLPCNPAVENEYHTCHSVEKSRRRTTASTTTLTHCRRLPANYRLILILSQREGLTNQEIAQALRLTVDTVKIRLHRKLRKELGDGCNFYRDERNEPAVT